MTSERDETAGDKGRLAAQGPGRSSVPRLLGQIHQIKQRIFNRERSGPSGRLNTRAVNRVSSRGQGLHRPPRDSGPNPHALQNLSFRITGAVPSRGPPVHGGTQHGR